MVDVLIELVENFAALLALIFLFSLFSRVIPKSKTLLLPAAAGLLFGTAAVFGMVHPIKINAGVMIDTRIILAALAGTFGGPVSAAIAVLIAAAYLLVFGGVGTIPGIVVMIAGGVTGSFFSWEKIKNKKPYYRFWILGLLLALINLAATIFSSNQLASPALKQLFLPVMLATPLATLIYGYLFSHEIKKQDTALKLLESELHIRTISNNFQNGMIYQVIILKDGTRKFTYLSDSVKTLYGVSPEQGKADANLIYSKVHEDDISRLMQEETTAQKTLSTLKTELRIKNPSGTIRWASIVSKPTALEDGSICWDGLEFIITGRKLAEDALRDSESRFRLLAENSTDMISRHDLQGLYLYVSPACRTLLGYEPEEMIGHSAFEYIHPDDAATVNQSRADIVNQPVVSTTMFRARRKDGLYIWLETTSHTILDKETGAPQEIHAASRNISARKRAEAERQALLEIMQGAVVTKDLADFLQNIHHAIAQVIWAENFMVILYNKETDLFEEVYSVDQVDPPAAPARLGKSLSAYVFRSGEPLLGTQENFNELVKQAEVELVGTSSPSWLGVPLKTAGETIGVMVVQDYENPSRYQKEDLDFLTSVAGQAALAVERKQTEDARKESEERFLRLFQNLNSNFMLHEIILDRDNKPCDYRYLEINPAAEKAIGVKAADIVGKTAMELFPGTEQYWIDKFGEVALTGVPIQYENYSKELNRYFEMRIYSPKMGQFALLGLDITERRQTEEALKKSEALYQDLVETSQDLIWQCDADGRYAYLNPAWEQVFGYKVEEMLGKKFGDFQTVEIAARDESEFKRLMQGNSVTGYETTHIGKSGKEIHLVFNAKFLTDENGNPIGTLGTAYDITERKQAEEALRESEERYRTVVSNTPVVTFVTDEKGVFILSEGKGLTKLGLQPGQVVGMSVFDEYHDYPEILETMKNALSGQNQRHEVSVQGIVFDVVYTPIFNEQGKVSKVIGVSNDITERKQVEEEIRKLNTVLEDHVRERTAQLEAANKELESFSYSISHDLRAPLRAIDGLSRMIQDEYTGQLPEEGLDMLNKIHINAGRMNQLIDDLLRFSRYNRQPLNVQLIQPLDIIQKALELLKNEQAGRDVEIVIVDLPACKADPSLLTQVWINLLSNALKYSRNRPQTRIEVGCQTGEKNEHVYFVRDNGTGFDMRFADKLFGVFQRLHSESEFEGTGVGLALVQRIISRHGGRIWAEAQVDKGATFYFTLGEI